MTASGVIIVATGKLGPGGITSPTDVLTAIKTVDGTGSGLDADTVDGMHAADFDPDGAAADAQAAAIAAAASDATTKANTAVSTAAADATSKVAAEAVLRAAGDVSAIATAAADATSKASTAQATAIATASGDATTKANAAQAAAIAAAASDATTKANTAISTAAADATAKVAAQHTADLAALRAAPRAPYLGIVATRCRIPNSTIASSTFPKTKTWSRHRAVDNIAACDLTYTAIMGAGEISTSAGPGTVQASVEYPLGTITRVLFGGSNTGTIPANDHVTSDLTTLTTPIPAGGVFWVCTYVDWLGAGATNTPMMFDGMDPYFPATYTMEATTIGAGISSDVMIGTRSTTGHNAMDAYRPTKIRGYTQRPTFALCGDSRTRENLAWETTIDAEGFRGITENVIGGRWGALNLGVGGDLYTSVLSGTGNNYTKRLQLAADCTHIIDDYGLNSMSTSQAQMKADVAAFRAKFGTRPYYKTTIVGQITSLRAVSADASDQTAFASILNLVDHNNWVRQGASGLIDGYLELEDLLTFRRDSGKWKPAQRVVTDAAMTAASNVVTSATGNFTSEDIGKGVVITGVGAAGATIAGLIGPSGLTSTTFQLRSAASTVAGVLNATTTATGQTMGIGVYTLDGIHPTRDAERIVRESNAYRPLQAIDI